MSTFHLQIVTPERLFFDGEAERVVVRSTEGDLCILKGHTNFVSGLAIGELKIKIDGQFKSAALAGGFIKVAKDMTTIVADTCEWSSEIDLERAQAAKERAELALQEKKSRQENEIASAKLKKALNRINVANK